MSRAAGTCASRYNTLARHSEQQSRLRLPGICFHALIRTRRVLKIITEQSAVRLLMELRPTADRSSLPVAQLLRGVTTDACLVCRSGSEPKSVSGLIRSVGLQKKPVVEVGASLSVAELQQGVTTDACLVCWSGSVPKSVSGLVAQEKSPLLMPEQACRSQSCSRA